MINKNKILWFTGIIFMSIMLLLPLSFCSKEKKDETIQNNGETDAKVPPDNVKLKKVPLITRTTCLDCHPAIKDGGFDIDFKKVKEAGMVRGKNMDVPKEEKEKSEK